MPMKAEDITRYIQEAFPDASIELVDLAGDGDHYSVTVTAREFANKTRIQQHKMVYDALQGHMSTTLHALQVKTKIPTELQG